MSTTAYPSDLTYAQWKLLEPLLPPPKPGGRKRSQSLSSSAQRDFLCHFFRLFMALVTPRFSKLEYRIRLLQWLEKRAGIWELIHQQLRNEVREQNGRQTEPSKGIIESLSVKTVETAKVETRGFDVHKSTKGRKRHILVDTMGLLLAVIITAANVTDRDGALSIFDKIHGNFPLLKVIRADQAYSGVEYTSNVQRTYHRQLEIVKREKGSKGFQVLPSRWIVSLPFGWLNHFRRFRGDYERQPQTSENFIDVAMISIMLRRLA